MEFVPYMPGQARLERIRQRAHALYKARSGGEHGQDLEDWLRAEREIDSEMEQERKGDD